MNIQLFIIDPQNDFCSKDGALYVPGADEDMKRLSQMIIKNKDIISDIRVSMDNHSNYHIAHSCFWMNERGENPPPFTIITRNDVESGVWRAANPSNQAWALDYVKTLEFNARYLLCIWPSHCITGTWGFCLNGDILNALEYYEKTKLQAVNYIIKGANPFTEHYSAFMSDVVVYSDKSTFFNIELLSRFKEADKILIAGEALSHCVANTLYDLASGMNENLSKVILLGDATSSVAGFEHLGEDALARCKSKGMHVATTKNFRDFL